MKRIIRQEIEVYEARYLKVDHDSINWDDLARVRHGTALAKVPLVVKYVTEVLEGGVQKIVVFAHHRDVIAQLVEGLSSYQPVTVIGGMGPQERQDSIDAFQDEPLVRVFIGNIQAAGTGITLAPASSRCIFAELSWTPAEMTQCEDRLHQNWHHRFGECPAPCSGGISRCNDGQGPAQKAKGPGCCPGTVSFQSD